MKAGDFDAAGYLWGTLTKSPDEDHITYTEADVEALWHLGFVDAERYSLETWINAWEPYHRPNQTYVVSESEFRSLDQFRYRGELYAPFDPRFINEGQYTDEGFQELVDASIAPSCAQDRATLQRLVEDLKSQVRLGNGLLEIGALAKQAIGKWIIENPSPLRRLELMFHATFQEQLAEMQRTGQMPATETQLVQTEASTFSMLRNTTELQAQGLKAVEKSKQAPAADSTAPSGPRLKDIRRSRRGMKT